MTMKCKDKEKVVPNGHDCSECEHFDPVNGCWNGQDDIFSCLIWVTNYSGMMGFDEGEEELEDIDLQPEYYERP